MDSHDEPATRPDAQPTMEHSLLRPVLWLVLILSAAANATLSTIGASPVAVIGFGLITLACAATLVVHHYRNRPGPTK